MSLTTKLAFAITSLVAAHNVAEAKPRRIVILDFDGPRELADTSNAAVREALADYDLVAKKRWETAQSNAQRAGAAGPTTWAKAAKSSGVDAVIEGWVQDEGRHKVLTVIVRDAATGTQYDQLTVKVGAAGLSPAAARLLHDGLEDRLEYIVAGMDDGVDALPKVGLGGGKPMVGAHKPKVNEPVAVAEDDDATPPPSTKTKKAKKTKPAETLADVPADVPTETPAKDEVSEIKAKPPEVAAAADVRREGCYDIFGDCSKDPAEVIGTKLKHVPFATPRFRIGGGGYLASRSLTFDADNMTNISQYTGVAGKGLSLSGEVYPWPLTKTDGQLSGLGFSLQVYKSVGSIVGIDTETTSGDYTTNQNGFMAAIHWRQPLGILHLDGEVGYSQDNYVIEDPPEGYEVPDTAYTSVHAGVHLDLSITDRATVGFGARYFYVTGTGDISSTEFFGPADASGFSVDTSFQIPLPKDLYIRGLFEYKRFTSTFSGGGVITDQDGVREGVDGTLGLHVNLGIQF